MSDNIVLHKTTQQNAARRLLFLAPLFLANSIFVISRWLGHAGGDPATLQQVIATALSAVALPVVYAVLWANVLSQRVCVDKTHISDGLHVLARQPVSGLVEITGDVGSERDDFRDSIILRFADGNELTLYVEDYDEKEMLAFLAHLKKQNPDCICTYSDIISLESRGLLRFLVSSVEPDNVILKLSKSPFEDTVLKLVQAHEKIFWWLFGGLWTSSVVGLSLCSMMLEAERRAKIWDPTGTALKLHDSAGSLGAHLMSFVSPQMQIAYQTVIDYFTHDGLGFMTTVWLLFGLIAFFVPIIRLLSPTFLFVDGNSMGMGTRFLPWSAARKLTLEHGSNLADSLEGTLTVDDEFHSSMAVDLRRVSDLKQRQLLLRLIDNYAREAQRNDEFMRTTNTLVDLQYTDIWLDSKQSSVSATEDASSAAAGQTGDGAEGRTLAGGKYSVERPLGFGGQGTAYLGRATTPPAEGEATEVVIKELVLPNFADVRVLQDATSRFQRGAVLLEGLRHEQIVRLWDHFVEGGKAFLVLEYIEGRNLRQVIAEKGAFSVDQVCTFGLQMCDILEYLHSQDPAVVHCDFAPENLILTPGGKIKLVDFDVAQVLDARAYSFVAGRPAYTPPEQFRGQPTAQSDLFALGGILHFLLKGVDPSPLGATPEESDGEQSELEVLIKECLSFEMSERPASASDIRERLRQFVRDNCGDDVVIRLVHAEKAEIEAK